jgi:hypothetical protein
VLPRFGVRVLVILTVVTSCSAPGSFPGTTYDCDTIQGPLSTSSFYEDNPTYVDPVDDSASWTTSTPEAEGMDTGRLERASATLADLPFTWSFLVVRGDAIVFERYYHGSAKNQSNNVHSASKSIWGAAIGVAIDQDRRLDPAVALCGGDGPLDDDHGA